LRQIIRKQPGSARGARAARRRIAPASSLLPALAGLVLLPACHRLSARETIGPRDLREARPLRPVAVQRVVCDDAVASLPFYRPLGPRAGLLVIRSTSRWKRLARLAPDLEPPGDLHDRVAIVLVARAGIPVDGGWPIRLRALRALSGIGYADIAFAPGNYLPDGTTYLEVAIFREVEEVAMADVNGSRYYPGTLAGSR